MKLYYTDPTTGNKVVVGLPAEADVDAALAQLDPLGTLSITILNDSDLIPQTPEEAFQSLVAQFDAAVEAHLHAEAVASGYTNIERACMYSSYPNPYWGESRSFVAWVGAVWAYCYEQVEQVKQGLREVPTVPQIISELPLRVLA
jgi:hypothetical protein